MVVIYSIASYLLSLLMPDYVYADAYQTSSATGWFGFLDPNKIVTVAGAVALSVITMIGVRRKRKKAEKSKEVYRNRYQSQESGKTYFISNKFPGSQSRAAKKVKWILEDAYKAVVGQYETSMKKSVMDIHYDCETARLEFERTFIKKH